MWPSRAQVGGQGCQSRPVLRGEFPGLFIVMCNHVCYRYSFASNMIFANKIKTAIIMTHRILEVFLN